MLAQSENEYERFNASYEGGTNSAILCYQGAPNTDPVTAYTAPENQLKETDLHALINPGAPGIPEYGKVDINLHLSVDNVNRTFYVSKVPFKSPTAPVLFQILSGAQEPSQLLPNGSVFFLEANKAVELTLSTTDAGGPHPIHLHGHGFDVDMVSAGSLGQQMLIRWVTDNSGPWLLHCHIDWHLGAFCRGDGGKSLGNPRTLVPVPDEWDQLCPIFGSLSPHS
ncbi:Cupredoxin [Suillus weaverae]|nr:Cupredoxin [Suillus weaverae]